VRGSHGRLTDHSADGPLLISSERSELGATIAPTAVRDVILSHLFD
jgi:hypothetical protein